MPQRTWSAKPPGISRRPLPPHLDVLRDRDGRFCTELFERYQRSEKALVSALAEMYVQGGRLAGR